MNPPTFYGSKVDEEPQVFIDEVLKVVDAMGVYSREKAELAAYQLKDVAQVWYEQWKEKRFVRAGPIDWGVFKINKDRVSNPKSQGGNKGGSSMERPTCAKCGKKHEGKYLVGMGVCYGCGKNGQQLKDYPTRSAKGREGNQAPPSGSNSDAPKKNRFYALQSRNDQEGSPDVVTGMLQVFSIDVYALLDPVPLCILLILLWL
ncbi:uncharacterized protein LOC125821803 [Solanum verrucosum]|uniref:uncharacterized protein LOC125821803 n=1 Tax=Solanum verrucosum TaxID=315347 RepID=UPI0020D0B47F|nr:uncharacterized protein LOC125821803 [Solanum verrucosum]